MPHRYFGPSLTFLLLFLITVPIRAKSDDTQPGAVSNVTAYGALADGQRVFGCSISAGTYNVTCAAGTFATNDVGKAAHLQFAGTAGRCGTVVCPLVTTIVGFVSSSTVTLAASATTTASNQIFMWGTDNTAAIQSAIDDLQDPNVLEQAIYFPRNLGQPANGDPSPYQGSYMITGRIYLPESTLTRNKYLKLYGDGYLSSTIQQLTVGTPIFDIQALGYGGTGTIIDSLGMLGPANYSTVDGAGIYCHLCIQLQMTENWMNGFQYDIEMAPNGLGTGSTGLYLNFNTFEEGISAVYWPGGSGSAALIAVGNIIDMMAYSYTGGYAFDLNGLQGVTIDDTQFGPGVGRGVRCIGCTSFKLHHNDFSLTPSTVYSPSLWSYQNLYLRDTSTGEVDGNTFHSENAEAIDIAGGNNGMNFGLNTYNGTQSFMIWSGSNNSVSVTEQTITRCASPCIVIPSNSMSQASISDNTFSSAINMPVSVTGGPVPSGSYVATGSDDVAVHSVSASEASVGSLQASSVSVQGGGTFGSLNTSTESVRALQASNIDDSGYGGFGSISAYTGWVGNLSGSSLSMQSAGFGTLSASNAYLGNLGINNGLLVQGSGSFGNVASSTGAIGNLQASHLGIAEGGGFTTSGRPIAAGVCEAHSINISGVTATSKISWSISGNVGTNWPFVTVQPHVIKGAALIAICNPTTRALTPSPATIYVAVIH